MAPTEPPAPEPGAGAVAGDHAAEVVDAPRALRSGNTAPPSEAAPAPAAESAAAVAPADAATAAEPMRTRVALMVEETLSGLARGDEDDATSQLRAIRRQALEQTVDTSAARLGGVAGALRAVLFLQARGPHSAAATRTRCAHRRHAECSQASARARARRRDADALRAACENGDVGAARALLRKPGIDVNVAAGSSLCALHWIVTRARAHHAPLWSSPPRARG